MITSAARTDPGRRRRTNQDAYLTDDDLQLYLLADGMGGHAAGGTAAHMTVNAICEFVRRSVAVPELTWPYGYDLQQTFEQNVLQTAIRIANSQVCREAEQNEAFAGMGSTVVALWINCGRAHYCHLGDSRLYLLRGNRLQQLTEDHSLVQQQLALGLISKSEARTHAYRNVVTRAVGVPDNSPIPVGEAALEEGDRLMLACDGLTDPLDDDTLQAMLLDEPDPHRAGHALVDAANRAGGPDNITVVLVDYRED